MDKSAPDQSPPSPPSRSLPEVHGSLPVAPMGSWWRRFLAFAGPGYLVSVGYMDPGNWATDLAGGAKFGYALVWVILLSNLMAIFLQTLCVRLGIASGRDLAQACRDRYSRPVAFVLWILCEIAIIACDLAEVIGSAVALNLLFGIPLVWGVLITSFDVMLLLAAMHFGFRKIEAIILTLVTTVAVCFAIQVFLADPDWGGVLLGTFVPTIPNAEAFYIALGILGATVMPHNLYLHTALVQTRDVGADEKSKRQAIRYNTTDTVIALGAAFFVNASILVVAAAVFHKNGQHGVSELQEAHRLLAPLLGAPIASILRKPKCIAASSSMTSKPVRITPQTSGTPNRRLSATAEPMTSARSQAMIAISQSSQRTMETGFEYCWRQACARSLPVTTPSFTHSDCRYIAMRFDSRMTQMRA